MTLQVPFFEYNGQVWSAAYASFNYLANFISQDSPADQVADVATVVYNIMLNSLNAINANTILTAWQAELINLQAVQAIPITVPATVTTALNNRVSALGQAIVALEAITPDTVLVNIPILLNQNIPAIPTCELLNFYKNFDYETPPAGTTDTNLVQSAQTLAANYEILVLSIAGFQGVYTTPAYDAAVRLQQTSQMVANILSGLASGPISTVLPVNQNWNQIVTLPSLLSEAFLLSTPPFSLAVQQQEVIRYILLTLAQQLAWFLLILRNPQAAQINLATVMQGDSLMDVAARNLGNFEQWTDIAAINNLLPPYVGPSAAPGLVAWGQQVILPGSGVSLSSIGSIPSYNINYLGTDLYVGPINGDMPPWTGDFQTTSGYNNLRWALGRRLQTTLGQLIYHTDYGCRIPPEVGAIQDTATGGLINAFGVSALLSDPRVASVITAVTQLLPNFAISFAASVQPGGLGTTAVQVNEVISPQA